MSVFADQLNRLLDTTNGFLYGSILLVLLLFSGVYFSIRTRVVQFRMAKEGIRLLFQESDNKEAVSGFQALMVSCASRLGVGNITGVASAIILGGPGAIFWMWMTAALGGAAVLGAPLGHDFCIISLSDLLTPWETIEKRLLSAAAADFVICLYNPASRKRKDYLKKACEILMNHKPTDTVCGIVRNIAREGEAFQILTLGELKDAEADMFSTVYIGNHETKVIRGRMVTPRGYQL